MKLNKISKNLILASFIGTFGESLFLPVYPIFTENIGGSILDVGLGFAIFSIVTGLFVASFGQTDWFDKNKHTCLIYSTFVFLIADLGLLLVTGKYGLFVIQGMLGLGMGLFNSSWDAMYSEDDESSQAKKWSFWTGGVNFVVGIASLLGAVVVAIIGYKGLFITMAAIDIITIWYAMQSSKLYAKTLKKLKRNK
jgi:MFS family permease